MSEVFVNKVAESALVTIDLEDYFPKMPIEVFDLKGHLFMELILKEKDFREALKATDWTIYQDQVVAVCCSVDAIIPMWAYMLVGAYLQPYAKRIEFGQPENVKSKLLEQAINAIDASDFLDKRVVIKGCGEMPIDESAYLTITTKLRPVAKSIMYGEPCSTVPIYKKAKPIVTA